MEYLFDVDGTLTPSRASINSEFLAWFFRFTEKYSVSLVTGSDREKTIEQVGSDLLRSVKYCFNCAGNEVYQGHRLIHASNWHLPLETRSYLEGCLNSSPYPYRFGQHFEARIGMLNFSVVGRGAQGAERTHYYCWDQEHHEREKIIKFVNENWPELSAALGGETSIDIFPKGQDKAQILKYFSDEICFFGDRCLPGGNDFSLAWALVDQKRGTSYNVLDWKDTWKTLRNLCPNV